MIAEAVPVDESAERRARHSAAYAALKREIVAAGLLRRSYGFYAALISFSFVGYALSAWAIYAWEAYPALLLACLAFSFFTVQIAGLMHDAGHRAAFKSHFANNCLGVAATTAIGMVFSNWIEHHNRHHARPNREGVDPDMEVPFLALTRANYSAKDRAQRFAVRWQAYYYFPLGALVSLSNRLGSILYFVRDRRAVNLLRLAAYLPAFLLLFAAPFVLFPLEKALFVFVVVHVTTGMYLASCFAPNHKGMRTYERDEDVSFLEEQVTTARNVRGGFLTDLLLVGLNHQIEHHLFPNCPRNKLGLLRDRVRRVCEEQGIEFYEVGFVRTNRTLVKHLHAVSRSAV